MELILIIVLVVLVFGGGGYWGRSRAHWCSIHPPDVVQALSSCSSSHGDAPHYRRRDRQADALNEYAIAESLRGILVDEQDSLFALATALDIDAPDPGIAD